MSITWTAMSGILGLMAAGLLVQFGLIYSQRRALRQQQRQIGLLRNDIGALCAGAVGADRRVSNLERQGRNLDMQQQNFATRQQADRPYGEAIQLVHEGASPAVLVERLGLSLSEAELVVMLHGNSKSI